MAIELSANEKKMLKDLEELLEFGFQKFSSIPVGWSQIKRRKQLLFQMFAAVHSQVTSISLLLKTGRTFSAEILLRSVQETLINADYILVGRNNLTVNRFLVGSNNQLIKQINKMITYFKANPDHYSGSTLLDLKALQKALKRRERETKSYLRHFNYRVPRSQPTVEEKVIAIDKEFVRLRHKQPNVTQQWMYLTQYWIASEQVHLSARGLLNYAAVSDEGITLFVDGKKSDIETYIIIASAMYLDMLYVINSQFKTPTRTELKPWRAKIMASSKSKAKSTAN